MNSGVANETWLYQTEPNPLLFQLAYAPYEGTPFAPIINWTDKCTLKKYQKKYFGKTSSKIAIEATPLNQWSDM